MGCGCGSAAGTEQYTVTAPDQTVKTFTDRTEARAYAAVNGGVVRKR